MAMGFLLNDIYGDIEPSEVQVSSSVNSSAHLASRSLSETWRKERRKIPELENILARPRLIALLDRSTEQYGATLISARAGSGKTTLAADYSRKQSSVSWCTLEPSDADWDEFSQILRSSISGKRRTPIGYDTALPSEAVIAEFVADYCMLKSQFPGAPMLVYLELQGAVSNDISLVDKTQSSLEQAGALRIPGAELIDQHYDAFLEALFVLRRRNKLLTQAMRYQLDIAARQNKSAYLLFPVHADRS